MARSLYILAAALAASAWFVAPNDRTFFAIFLVVFAQNVAARADRETAGQVISSFEAVKERDRKIAELERAELTWRRCSYCTRETVNCCELCGVACCDSCQIDGLCPGCQNTGRS